MAQLNDEIATRIMGELDGLTKKIARLDISLEDKIESLPSAADKEMKRAGAAAVSALSEEIGKISKTVALESAAAERQKSFVWAAGSMTIFGAAMYAAGLVLGSQSAGGMGWGYLTAISMAIGIASGLLLFQILSIGERLEIKTENGAIKKSSHLPHSNKKWTEQEIRKTAKSIEMYDPVTNACVPVMTGAMTLVEAAEKYGFQPKNLQEFINRIENT